MHHFTNNIEVKMLRHQMQVDCEYSGVKLLIMLNAEMVGNSSTRSAISSARVKQIDRHVKVGLTSSSTRAFTKWLQVYNDLMATLKGSPSWHDKDYTATVIEELMRRHSGELNTVFTVQRNSLRTDAMVARRAVDDYATALSAALFTFGALEADAAGDDAEDGKTLFVRDGKRKQPAPKTDPSRHEKKTPGDKPKREWVPAKDWVPPAKWEEPMRTCNHCKDAPVDGGRHLDKSCPLKGGKQGGAALARGDSGGAALARGDALLSKELAAAGEVTVNIADLLGPGATQADAMAALTSGRSLLVGGHAGGAHDRDHDHVAPMEGRAYYVYGFGLGEEDLDSTGIFYGNYKFEISPALRGEGASKADVAAACKKVSSLEQATLLCKIHGFCPRFFGPGAVDGLQPGDLLQADESSDDDDDEPARTLSPMSTPPVSSDDDEPDTASETSKAPSEASSTDDALSRLNEMEKTKKAMAKAPTPKPPTKPGSPSELAALKARLDEIEQEKKALVEAARVAAVESELATLRSLINNRLPPQAAPPTAPRDDAPANNQVMLLQNVIIALVMAIFYHLYASGWKPG